jgi:hypothetical protein
LLDSRLVRFPAIEELLVLSEVALVCSDGVGGEATFDPKRNQILIDT